MVHSLLNAVLKRVWAYLVVPQGNWQRESDHPRQELFGSGGLATDSDSNTSISRSADRHRSSLSTSTTKGVACRSPQGSPASREQAAWPIPNIDLILVLTTLRKRGLTPLIRRRGGWFSRPLRGSAQRTESQAIAAERQRLMEAKSAEIFAPKDFGESTLFAKRVATAPSWHGCPQSLPRLTAN